MHYQFYVSLFTLEPPAGFHLYVLEWEGKQNSLSPSSHHVTKKEALTPDPLMLFGKQQRYSIMVSV